MLKKSFVICFVFLASFLVERQVVTSKKEQVNFTEESSFVDQTDSVDVPFELDFDTFLTNTLNWSSTNCFFVFDVFQTFKTRFLFAQKTPFYLLFQSLKIG